MSLWLALMVMLIGVGVAGPLTAASSIQIVVGRFMPHGYKIYKKKQQREHSAASTLVREMNTLKT